ncbi:hypothetical protein ABN222_08230 [Providencia alcalifaciens]|jgi:hypothetical protein
MCSQPELNERKQKVKYENEGRIYEGRPSKDWPKLNVRWNLNKTDFYRSLDGENTESIEQHYPNGFFVATALTKDIHDNLCYASKVFDSNDFWSVCNVRKACGVIGRWMNNELITPPVIVPFENTLVLVGGNHRFNVARLAGEKYITFIVPSEKKDETSLIIPNLSW